MIDIEELLKEYKHLCRTDTTNRKKLRHYNRIQCYIIARSGLETSVWVTLYAHTYAELIGCVNTVNELEELLYRKRCT